MKCRTNNRIGFASGHATGLRNRLQRNGKEVNGSITLSTVPKTPKKQTSKPAETPVPEAANSTPLKKPAAVKKAPAAKRPTASSKSAGTNTGAKKNSSGGESKPARKQRAKSTSASAAATEPSDSEIQLRAYFLAEKRLKHGFAGDSAHDWLEAKRQLVEEAAQPQR
ncbi:MAG: DUF2934 domain-containing protein [Chthoniobacterales bacterium]